MYIIGINSHHPDSSACIIKDGKLIAAVEEERFTRIKHWAGLPVLSIRHCLNEAKIKLSEVEYISLNRDPEANLFEKFKFILRQRPNYKLILDRIKFRKKYKNNKKMIMKEFENQEFLGKMINVEHHICHLSSAFNISPFKKSCILSVDGMGDFASTVWGFANDEKISIDEKIYYPHSLGLFYESITQFLGFNNYGDEYKVMGLAPYGKPVYMDQMRKILNLKTDGYFELNLDYFRHHREKIAYEWENGSPSVGTLFSSELEKLLGPARTKDEELTQYHKDIAHSVQAMYEEAFFHLLNNLYSKYNFESIAIAGGCGMNSVANGKIRLKTPFKRVYVQSAAGDAGGAIGSAFTTWHKIGGVKAKQRTQSHDHAYWGPSFKDEYIDQLLHEKDYLIKMENCDIEHITNITELSKKTASEIANGNVVGWFQGRMEWGPRALGNRSIICDPRRSDMKDILNLKIKRRESFRPFAPSILREEVPNWFEQDDNVPFMMQVYQIIKEKRYLIPAVTHIDGSGRLQTVSEKTNPRYFSLIREFNNLTNIPMLLNTSFNENEPVVCKPEEALETFLRTKMDLLVIGDWMIKRKNDIQN